MFRLFASFCFITVFAFSTAFAQDASATPEDIKVTPEILALFEESMQSLTQVEPNFRAVTLFHWLGFAALFDDKAPANRIINTLLEIAPAIEPVELRNQLYVSISHALCDLGEYARAIEILQRITQPVNRYRSQLDLAVRIIFEQEQDGTLPKFDTATLLGQVINAATAEQDRRVVAVACALLGREFARHGRAEESITNAFAEALRIAGGIDNIGEQLQAFQSILQSQVRYGHIEGARATVQASSDPEVRQAMTNLFAHALLENEKYDEAERLIRTLPAGMDRNVFVQRWIAGNIETITDAKIGELSALVTDDLRERFLQGAIASLQTNHRGDVARQVSRRLTDPAGAERALLAGDTELLLEERRFAEAIQRIAASSEEEEIKRFLTRQILMLQFELTHDETVVPQILATYSDEDRAALGELRERATQAATIADAGERMGTMFNFLQEQFRVFDVPGARQTMRLVSGELDRLTDPALIVDYRLILAQFQVELQDNEAVKENLGKLTQRLAAVRDLNELRDIVPPPMPQLEQLQAGVAAAVDAAAIQRQLFRVYLMTADLLARAEAVAESRSAFESAKAWAGRERDAMERAEMLFVLAQFLAERH